MSRSLATLLPLLLACTLGAQSPPRVLGSPLRHHDSMVRSVDFAPDGTRFVTSGWDGSVRVWSTEHSRPLLEIETEDALLAYAAFCKGGTRIVVLDPVGAVRTFDAATGEAQKERRDALRSMGAVSPDGRFLATQSGAAREVAEILDLDTLETVQTVPWGESMLLKFTWSPDSRYAVFGGSLPSKVVVWDTTDGKVAAEYAPSAVVSGIAVRPDGKALALALYPNLEVLSFPDLATPPLHSSGGSQDAMHTLLWGAGDSVIVGDSEGTLLAIDVKAAEMVWGNREHRDSVYSLARSPDGKLLASGSGDGTVRLWSLADGAERLRASSSRDLVRCLAFSPDGARIVAGDYGNAVARYELAEGEATTALVHDASVVAVTSDDAGGAWSLGEDNHFAQTAADGTTTKVALSTADEFSPLDAVRVGERAYLAGSDGSVRAFEVATGTELWARVIHNAATIAIAVAPDGKTLATCAEDGEVRVHSTDGETSVIVADEFEGVHSLTFCGTGRLAALSLAGELRQWTLGDEPTPIATTQFELAEDDEETTTEIVATADGKRLALIADAHLWLVDPASGKTLATLTDWASVPICIAFSPDGRQLAVGMLDSTILLWSTSALAR